MDLFRIFRKRVSIPVQSDGSYMISTKVKTLKAVWIILHDMGMEGLLTGKWGEVNVNEVCDQLLRNGKLNELCRAITGVNADFEELGYKGVGRLLSDFFTVTINEFYEFMIQIMSIVVKIQPEQTKD